MASINFELRENKENARGECPIYLRITHNRKHAWMSTPFRVPASKWNKDKQRIRRSHDRSKKLNHELEKLSVKAQNIVLRLKEIDKVDAKSVINRLKGHDSEDFYTYAEKFIENKKAQGAIRGAKNVKVIVNKVKDYDGSQSLPLKAIDLDFLNGLQAHLKNKYKNASNTIRKNFRHLRRILDMARKEKYLSANPFDEFDMPAYQKSEKSALTVEQIRDLENLTLKKGSSLWHTRHYFMFSFYNAGIRFGDLCKLKRENIKDGRLKYLMSKTRNNRQPKWKNIKLLPQALEILEAFEWKDKEDDEYLFPILDTSKKLDDPAVFESDKQGKNALVNKNLKKLAKKAEIDINLSTHIARHSFANFALKQGMSPYAISKALAHSDLKTTEHYLKSFDEEILDSEMEELFT